MTVWLWVGFFLLIFALLALDLGVVNRPAREIQVREALAWTLSWVVLSLLFSGLLYVMYRHDWLGIASRSGTYLSGRSAATFFLTAYLVEKSLSVDNLFVIAGVLVYFQVPPKYQHKLLFWGVFGALAMRLTLIALGTLTLRNSRWLVEVLGAWLVVSALRMLAAPATTPGLGNNRVLRFVRSLCPVTHDYGDGRFFDWRGGVRAATPLLLALVAVESADIMFAVDSIPAVLGVTGDPFVAFTSNAFAVLGLRSLYFVLAALVQRFRHVQISVFIILIFVGVKMLLSRFVQLSGTFSLMVVLAVLGVGTLASLRSERVGARASVKR